jgi:hypothetical protein
LHSEKAGNIDVFEKGSGSESKRDQMGRVFRGYKIISRHGTRTYNVAVSYLLKRSPANEGALVVRFELLVNKEFPVPVCTISFRKF